MAMLSPAFNPERPSLQNYIKKKHLLFLLYKTSVIPHLYLDSGNRSRIWTSPRKKFTTQKGSQEIIPEVVWISG